ncbi:MAG: DUF547 domain-containing protein [Cyanobacteria bacterium]|nr:DUF547 domain-containing protein [Cyanobacteriota bacterium]
MMGPMVTKIYSTKIYAKVTIIYLISLVIGVSLLFTKAWPGKVLNDALLSTPFQHQIWNDVLNAHVDSEGAVDFDKLKAFPKRLNQYIKQLEAVSPESKPESFPTRDNRLAYWINAHNAIAMRLILDQYPVEKVTEIKNYRQNRRYKLGGVPYSLKDIENLLNTQYYLTPNLFFSITDFSLSDPPLLNEAFEGRKIRQQLQNQATQYIEDSRFVRMGPQCKQFFFSPLFKQFREPLERFQQEKQLANSPTSEPLINFIKPYLAPELQGEIVSLCQSPEIEFMPYKSQLNRFIP